MTPQECTELSITGSNIPEALAQLQHQLPSLYADALSTVNDGAITNAMQHYAAFTAYAHSNAAPNASSQTADMLLSNLANIRNLHTVTATAASIDISAGVSAQPSRSVSNTGAQQTGTEEDLQKQSDPVDIDWDVIADSSEPSANSASMTEAAVGVDWDIGIQTSDAAADQVQPQTDAQATDIDWDIDMTDSAQEQTDSALPAEVEDSEGTDAGAQQQRWPESVVRLSQDSTCRASLLDDLYELDAFLQQQAQELSSGDMLMPTAAVVAAYPLRLVGYPEVPVHQGLLSF